MLNYTSGKHPLIFEDGPNCHEFVQVIDCLEHLRQWLVVARSLPRLLHHWDMLHFGLGAAGTIRKAKQLNCIGIMHQSMLLRERNTFTNTFCNKNFPKAVEISQELFKVRISLAAIAFQ
jgi:hypothetical protein